MALNLPKMLSDHPSLVGIVRFPSCNITGTDIIKIPVVKKEDYNYTNNVVTIDVATNIQRVDKESEYISISKAKFTDFYPYTYYVLTDGEADPLILHPQYLPSSFKVRGKFALSNSPIERYFVDGYKGDNTGTVYNITNVNQMMLPTATNEGMGYMNANANAIAQTRRNQIEGNILQVLNIFGSGVATKGMSFVGNGVSSAITGVNEIKATDKRNKDIMLTPSTISSFGTPSTRNSFGTDSVRLLKYTVRDTVKNKIENYTKRYGHKFNNYATIDIKTYKGYLKAIAPNINGGIDNNFISQIKEIFERGVYIE